MVVQIVVLEAFSNGGKTFVDFLVKLYFEDFLAFLLVQFSSASPTTSNDCGSSN